MVEEMPMTCRCHNFSCGRCIVPATPARPLCPSCSSPDIAPYNFGTDAIAEAYRKMFPAARVCCDCGEIEYGERGGR